MLRLLNIKNNYIFTLSDRNLYFKFIFLYKIKVTRKARCFLFSRASNSRSDKRQLKKIAREKNCRTHQHVTWFSDMRVTNFGIVHSYRAYVLPLRVAWSIALSRWRGTNFLAYCWSFDALIPRVAEPSREQIFCR